MLLTRSHKVSFAFQLFQVSLDLNKDICILFSTSLTTKSIKINYKKTQNDKKIRFITDVNTARIAYFSYFHSIISYGILLWRNAANYENN